MKRNIRDIIRNFNQTCDEHGFLKRKVLARGTDACKKLAGVKDVQFKYWKTEIPFLLIDAVFELYTGEMNAALMTELLQSFWGLAEEPVFEAFKRKKGYVMKEMANVPVEQFHSSNDGGSDYHRSVDTIHGVKGATLDAVLLFLSPNSRAQNISLNDFSVQADTSMTEKQRLIYVACSRASQFLALAVPGSVSDDVIERVFDGVEFDYRLINLQGELVFEENEVEN